MSASFFCVGIDCFYYGELAFHIKVVGHSVAWFLQVMPLNVMGARLPEG
jgi:hypothetical protein